jgi:hypothetical protein
LEFDDGRCKDAFVREVYEEEKCRPSETESALGVKLADIEDNYIAFANTLCRTKISK